MSLVEDASRPEQHLFPDGVRKRNRTAEKSVSLGDGLSFEQLAPLPQANISRLASHDPLLDPKDRKSAQTKTSLWTRLSTNQDRLGYRLMVVVFTVLAFATRFYKISNGNFVLWDEAHFGKFGTHYIDGTFYFDVHPPLGKMLIGLAGRIAGYTGGYAFTSGEKYPPNVPYVAMRMIVAAFGSLTVPFGYVIAKNLGFSEATCLLTGAMCLLEVGLVSITRLILLDSMLIFFVLAVMTFYTAFRKQAARPFTLRWHFNLLLTGAAIGCVSSVKWVGLFITGLVGFMTIDELWRMFGDWNVSSKTFSKHFAFRALYLIVCPVAIYLFCFRLHFGFLFRSGPGNSNMSSLFQAGLEGVPLGKSPLEVAFGSRITLRNARYASGLLHSHVQAYPEGSKQQQATLYSHSDSNNDWVIHRHYSRAINGGARAAPSYQDLDYTPQILRDGDHVRLFHKSTGRYLHSHFVSSSVTAQDFEVSCYGGMEFDDPNDVWVVEVARETYRKGAKGVVRSLFTQLRFRHVNTGCYLRSSGRTLPEWGFKQGEVSCRPHLKPGNAELNKAEFMWNVESNVNSHLPEGDTKTYRSRFLNDFLDHNTGMWKTNNALTPDPELEPSALTSKPQHWMFLLRGLRMSGFSDDAVKFYMLGNPLIWWLSAVSVSVLAVLFGVCVLMDRRGALQWTEAQWDDFSYKMQVTVGGWLFNYLPYFLMGRVTYLHHYYPALLFAILSTGFLFEHVTRRIAGTGRNIAAAVLVIAMFAVFVHFSPLAYGFTGPHHVFSRSRRWLKTWNM